MDHASAAPTTLSRPTHGVRSGWGKELAIGVATTAVVMAPAAAGAVPLLAYTGHQHNETVVRSRRPRRDRRVVMGLAVIAGAAVAAVAAPIAPALALIMPNHNETLVTSNREHRTAIAT